MSKNIFMIIGRSTALHQVWDVRQADLAADTVNSDPRLGRRFAAVVSRSLQPSHSPALL